MHSTPLDDLHRHMAEVVEPSSTNPAQDGIPYFHAAISGHGPLRIMNWLRRMTELEQFVADFDCLPTGGPRARREPKRDGEVALWNWVYRQRATERAGDLTTYQSRRLELIPVLDWFPTDVGSGPICSARISNDEVQE